MMTSYLANAWLVAARPGLQRRAKVRLSCRRARFQIPLARRKRACRRLVTGFFKPSRHVAMAWSPKTSLCLSRFMIGVRDFPVTSRRLPQKFPVTRVTGKFRWSRRNGIWALGGSAANTLTHRESRIWWPLDSVLLSCRRQHSLQV